MGKLIIDAHKELKRSVSMLKAFFPKTIKGMGVVPPVPKIINKVIENPKTNSVCCNIDIKCRVKK
jgi:hypothetical protein